MASKIRESRSANYRIGPRRSKPGTVHAPERGASKERLRKIAGQVVANRRYDAVEVVGRH